MDDLTDSPDTAVDRPSTVEDVSNITAFTPTPSQRRDTASSVKTGTDGGQPGDTCRICRSEATADEPLFYPCKCSGSIKFVHQECLMEWLSHSHKKHCELCKTPFRFTKLYDADMPTTLPWSVFIKRAFLHVAMMVVGTMRALLVAIVWLVILPLLIRFAWRWIFWVADAGWARQDYIQRMQEADVASRAQEEGSNLVNEMSAGIQSALYDAYDKWFGSVDWSSTDGSTNAAAAAAASTTNLTATATIYDRTAFRSYADASILSSSTYLSELTASPTANRIILDVFEGQVITCVVILGFILVFLIREWVVQQQPLVNVDQVNDEQREHERLMQERDRLRRQAQLMEEARQRLVALQQNEARTPPDMDAVPMDWQSIHQMIDSATREFGTDEASREQFATRAAEVMRYILAAEHAGSDAGALADRVYEDLRVLPDEQREAWEDVLLAELEARGARKHNNEQQDEKVEQPTEDDVSPLPESSTAQRRPPMPARATSSAATHIKRILEESNADASGLAGSSWTHVPPQESSMQSAPSQTEGSSRNRLSVDFTRRTETVSDAISHQALAIDTDAPLTHKIESEAIPITNAGPDAKVNIKRKGKMNATLVIPEPADTSASKAITSDGLKEHQQKLEELHRTAGTEQAATNRLTKSYDDAAEELSATSVNDNPFHPDGPVPGASPLAQSISELGALAPPVVDEDQSEEQLQISRAELGHEHAAELELSPSAQPAPAQNHDIAPQNTVQWLVDWFWGDIQPQNTPEPVPAAAEERVDMDDTQEAPFVPVQQGVPQPAHNVEANGHHEQHDPEVVLAAQQAGLDAEAIEDAEDLEGIFELIGLQGPLVGLFQTSCFCCVLVVGSVAFAIGMPYMWGKLVLVIINSPIESLIMSPLRFITICTDFLVDFALLVGGGFAAGAAVLVESIFSFVEILVPWLGNTAFTSWVYKLSKAAAIAAYHRLTNIIPGGGAFTADSGMQWAWLRLSMEAHTSLRAIQYEVNLVLRFLGNVITRIVETMSTGSATVVWQSLWGLVVRVSREVVQAFSSVKSMRDCLRSALTALRSAVSGSDRTTPFDPSLVYWSSRDRGMAVLSGYIALAMLAAVYVATDTPITSSPANQKLEKMVRDSLRQAGGVMKVILIISIEMLVFPLYCGLLLDVAFLPLQEGASLATRWAYANEAPYTFCFIHWFVGTCYMFHFALFVGMCRKILRKGVLWFIRDPDDPTFHPVRDVLERNVTTQLRKIAFSALVYGALVILCLGGVIWGIGRLFRGMFPIHWVATEPYIEFSVDLLLYTILTPTIWNLVKPSKLLHTMYAWWLRRCARGLRLSHFLFDERRKDEEGRHIRHTWASYLTLKPARLDEASMIVMVGKDEQTPEVTFERDGKYVLTPCSDQYRPPKPGEAFIHVEDNDVYIADKDGKRNEHFGKIYIPPHFRARMTVFMIGLWIFSAVIGLCATLLPLCFGRMVLSMTLPEGVVVNDIYAYSLGAYFFGGLLYLGLKGKRGAQYVREKASGVDVKAYLAALRKVTGRVLCCTYVYGFVGLVLPFMFALVLQFYFVVPLHTYLVSTIRPALEQAAVSAEHNSTISNSTVSHAVNATLHSLSEHVANVTEAFKQPSQPSVAEHSIHVLADSALGMLIGRILIRGIVTAPTSRAAEAFRRITADGYLQPNARLATRFLILPATILGAIVLLAPLGIAAAMFQLITFLGPRMVSNFEGVTEEVSILVYRYSYPVAAGWALSLWGAGQIAKATGRWRARIRDEVYLVGERLHNFGERKPPEGSKGVPVGGRRR